MFLINLLGTTVKVLRTDSAGAEVTCLTVRKGVTLGDVSSAKVALEFGVRRYLLQVVTILAADVSRIAVRVIHLRQVRVTRGLVLAGVDLRVLITRG